MTILFPCCRFQTVFRGAFFETFNIMMMAETNRTRIYDPTKGLSRAMDLRTDQVLKALESELAVPALQERSWIPWLPPREGVVRFRTTQFINFHGREKANKKLNRKVEALFKPADLGLNAAAQVEARRIFPAQIIAYYPRDCTRTRPAPRAHRCASCEVMSGLRRQHTDIGPGKSCLWMSV